MSVRLTDLPDALRDEGVEPVVVDGFATRGGDFSSMPVLHLVHWTAGPSSGVTPSLRTVTYGRPDLPYNLCTVLQSREGGTKPDKAYCVSSGRAVHAGEGEWEGITAGNSRGSANEVEWSGPAEPFPGNRYETTIRIARAHIRLQGSDPRYVCNHREYALPPGRKIDTNLDGARVRRDVAEGTDDMDAEERQALMECRSLLNHLVPRNARHVMLTGTDVGKVVPAGTPGSGPAADLWRWGLATVSDEHLGRIAAAVVAALPPSAGGSGVSPTEMRAIVTEVLDAELGFLKPGQ